MVGYNLNIGKTHQATGTASTGYSTADGRNGRWWPNSSRSQGRPFGWRMWHLLMVFQKSNTLVVRHKNLGKHIGQTTNLNWWSPDFLHQQYELVVKSAKKRWEPDAWANSSWKGWYMKCKPMSTSWSYIWSLLIYSNKLINMFSKKNLQDRQGLKFLLPMAV